ncbi:MAG: MerR family transcriptional regulator [Gemmatimonadetes bacterium]|nr:MerR family transcriptional regulator [Gemmatimonadota bacterium]
MPDRAPTPGTDTAALHPISVVAERTGLSRDVIRVWERRYGAVEPKRSAGGQRLYSDEHIDRFRLLAAATRHGRNISLVAGLATEELARLVAEDDAARPTDSPVDGAAAHRETADVALALVRTLDASGLDRALRRAVARHGVSAFLEDIAPSIMHRVGDEWHARRFTIAHEHLATAEVLAVVFEAMRAVPETPAAPRLLVATPSGERHGVGAALAAAAAALDGWNVSYLGVDVPLADIVAAATATDAGAVAVSVVHTGDPEELAAQLRALRSGLPAGVPLLVGGAAAMGLNGLSAHPGITVCGSIAEMRSVLARVWVVA